MVNSIVLNEAMSSEPELVGQKPEFALPDILGGEIARRLGKAPKQLEPSLGSDLAGEPWAGGANKLFE
jgi:hypothetical protein